VIVSTTAATSTGAGVGVVTTGAVTTVVTTGAVTTVGVFVAAFFFGADLFLAGADVVAAAALVATGAGVVLETVEADGAVFVDLRGILI